MKLQRQIPLVMALLATVATVATVAQPQGSFSEAGEKPYIDRQDWRGLLGYNQAWTRAEPGNPVAWYGLGMTYQAGLHDPREAADAFRRAVTLRPEWPQAWAHLSSAYSNLPGQPNDVHAKVLATLREQRQHMSQASAKDWAQLGLNFAQNGSVLDHEPYREAISAYTQSLNINAKDADVWNARGVVEENDLGDNSAALSDYQHAANLGLALGTQNYNQLRRDLAARASAASSSKSDPTTQLHYCRHTGPGAFGGEWVLGTLSCPSN
jgi:hypothetical protein